MVKLQSDSFKTLSVHDDSVSKLTLTDLQRENLENFDESLYLPFLRISDSQ